MDTKFSPAWASSPAATIADALEEKNLTTERFITLTQKTPQFIDQLLLGQISITDHLAELLHQILGSSPAFWLSRETNYSERLKQLNSDLTEECARQWLSEVSSRELIKRGWIQQADDSISQVRQCLRFFDSTTINSWRERYCSALTSTQFRATKTFEPKLGPTAAWLRKAEVEGRGITCDSWNPKQFVDRLPEIRGLTRIRKPHLFIPKLKSICCECGVALLVLRPPEGCRASGATIVLNDKKVVILLSYRYLSDDHFWFTFFHEAGHLILHQRNHLFVEFLDQDSDSQEDEANNFSASQLIPEIHHQRMMCLPLDGRSIIRFAREIGTSPGIVVGQLQHHGRVAHHQLNSLKTRFSWDNQYAY